MSGYLRAAAAIAGAIAAGPCASRSEPGRAPGDRWRLREGWRFIAFFWGGARV